MSADDPQRSTSAPGDLAQAIVFTPARTRTLVAVIGAALLGAVLALATVLFRDHVLWLLALCSGVLCLPAIWYSAFMTAPLTVRPGLSVQRRRPIRGVQTVPIDSTTEIVAFTKVGPRGWYVIRTGGQTHIRLSDQYWSISTLTNLARAMPASLRLRTKPTTVQKIAAEYPDYYSPLDEKYGWLAFVMILLTLPFMWSGSLAAAILLELLI